MHTNKNVTIYDIAKKAGTSPSTVGAVMNGSWQSRRISESRAEAIKKVANEMGYSVNLQASALRKERSGMIGMIVPMHDNRYFSSISQAFEEEARKRGVFPVVSSTLRDPKIEEDAVRLLLDYQVQSIVCTGATDPDAIADLCNKRGVKTYNLDLPGTKAPSVISDNHGGAIDLTNIILRGLSKTKDPKLLFIGGRPNDHNTIERIRGFKEAVQSSGFEIDDSSILTCGYAAEKAESALSDYIDSSFALPDAIFVNSTISLEGIMNWFKINGMSKMKTLELGCFDWDPFAALVQPNIVMARQNVGSMVSELFMLIDQKETNHTRRLEIAPLIVRN